MAYMRLGELLVSQGLITNEELERALADQALSHRRLGRELVEAGALGEGELMEALAEQLGIGWIDLTVTSVPPEAAAALPRGIAVRHSVAPVSAGEGELALAMADPLDFTALEEAAAASGRRVVPLAAVPGAVEKLIFELYGGEDAARARDCAGGGEESPVPWLVDSIIERALGEGASDLHFEPRAGGLVVRMRVEGELRHLMTLPTELQGQVISRLKVMGGMDTAERRGPQDGRGDILFRGRRVDLRFSTLPTMYGEKAAVRLLDAGAQPLTAGAIGLAGEDLRRFRALLRGGGGMVLIVGPTGAGKSTTMYAMLRELSSPEVNIVTLEDPVEYGVEGVNQSQVTGLAGMTFAGGLRSILRQDPDVIALGEIRDGDTAGVALRAAITGRLVLSTMHTGDALSAVERLRDLGAEPYLIAEALRGVIAQRLARRICPYCRESYTPSPEEAEALGIRWTPELVFYRGRGCPECRHSGLRGRRPGAGHI